MGIADDGEDSWEHRRDLVVSVFEALDADVVGIQEGFLFQLEYIEAALPDFAWVGISRQGNETGEYSAVFYRKDRFAVEETETFWMSETPDVPRSRFPGQMLPRICTWARLKPLDGGDAFYAFNTHLTHLPLEDVKAASAALVLERMTSLSGPFRAFLAGDFNTGPWSAAWMTLMGDGDEPGALVDTWPELGLPEEGSSHGFTGVSTGDRIDWILHTPDWHATEAQMVKTSKDGHYPSDHFPVVGEYAAVPGAEPPPGVPLGVFDLVFYWMAMEADHPGPPEVALEASGGQVLAVVSQAFADVLSLEGTGRLVDGRILNLHKPCAGAPTGWCYMEVDQEEAPYGLGSEGPLMPFRSIALDESLGLLGEILYAPAFHGLTLPTDAFGTALHDGCLEVTDMGWSLTTETLDLYVYEESWHEGVAEALGTDHVSLYRDSPACPDSMRWPEGY